ncbi:MAG: NAD-dependent epimerase/dehydratase family protein [Candidatus Thiodiazotropha sp. (ex Monitilora ramsayi)]|nr:NAD-dependent epimerase/dehydratase family protein [Candidatus Thiodiazotropha sp. (ex Monitilora ramsayi)]
MKVGITGANGFIGWHARCFLATCKNIQEVRLANRKEFSDQAELYHFVDGLDLIIHLAGVNRADPKELISGNIEPANNLVAALRRARATPCLAYTSSTKIENGDSPYAEGKAAVSQIFQKWARETGTSFINLIVPHVFGEYGCPNYNSAIATFAHQVANGEQPTIHNDGQLELIHVQDLVEQIIHLYTDGTCGDVRIEGRPTSVIEAVELLQQLHETYKENGQLPDLRNHFVRCMFNTLRGAIDYPFRHCTTIKHEDNRGWLVEAVKANSGGQCFISTTKPGITRGNHFHLRKVERFMVLQGQAEIKLRKLFSNEIISYELDGDNPSWIDIPTMHTHSITNVGKVDLITLFWADEIFDPDNPDTTFHEVSL